MCKYVDRGNVTSRRIFRQATLWMVFGLVISGCAVPVFITPPPVSELGPIDDIIIQTAAAAQSQTAISLPPSRTPTSSPTLIKTATISPTPTATVLFIIEAPAQESLLLEETAIAPSILSGDDDSDDDSKKTKTPIPKEWKCRILSKSPTKDTVITRGSSFKATWTIENTGTKTWPKQGVDVVFHSGADLHRGKPYVDLPFTVVPGGKVTITITMDAPKRSGSVSNRWTLMVGSKKFCGVKFFIEVK